MFNKGAKLIQWGRTVFLTNGAGTKDIHIQNSESRHRPFIPHKKNNLKWTMGLKLKHIVIKLLENNLGENLYGVLDTTQWTIYKRNW